MTDWECDAYGDLPPEVARCYFGRAPVRVCESLDQCRRAVAAERQRVYRRMNELAAAGDPAAAFLTQEITRPDQIFNGTEEP